MLLTSKYQVQQTYRGNKKNQGAPNRTHRWIAEGERSEPKLLVNLFFWLFGLYFEVII